MRQELFSVYDSAAKLFLPPFYASTVEVALRRFRATVNEPGSDFQRFPEDYTLFHVGSFLLESGMVVALETPHSLGLAVAFLEDAHGSQRELKLRRPEVEVVNGGAHA